MTLPLKEIQPEIVPGTERLIYNLNVLLGYFIELGEWGAVATVYHAEQFIKNYISSEREMVGCQYCGQWVTVDHVCPARGEGDGEAND